MAFAKLDSPQEISELLKGLEMSDAERKKLHKDLANQARRYFRGQISAQRDIHGTPYTPRRRRKPMYIKPGGEKVYRQTLQQGRNMLMGISKAIQTKPTAEGFEVGVGGAVGKVGIKHNDGKTIRFTYRMHGWFNAKSGKWEGGRKAHLAYKMPKRPFIGWNTEAKVQILNTIYQRIEAKAGAN